MQILTKKQVRYRRLVVNQSSAQEYCLGIEFQGKLFISDKFFAGDRQQQAINYCYHQYLAAGGKKIYLLVSNAAGLTVWCEENNACVVGQQNPLNAIASLKLDRLILQIQQIEASLESDFSQVLMSEQLAKDLKASLVKIIDLGQQTRDGIWIESIESLMPFHTFHRHGINQLSIDIAA